MRWEVCKKEEITWDLFRGAICNNHGVKRNPNAVDLRSAAACGGWWLTDVDSCTIKKDEKCSTSGRCPLLRRKAYKHFKIKAEETDGKEKD
jgi:hypothetical protein